MAVSYTHLDVYKRQTQCCLEQMEEICERIYPVFSRMGVAFVSYTHLDVYKRQQRRCCGRLHRHPAYSIGRPPIHGSAVHSAVPYGGHASGSFPRRKRIHRRSIDLSLIHILSIVFSTYLFILLHYLVFIFHFLCIFFLNFLQKTLVKTRSMPYNICLLYTSRCV